MQCESWPKRFVLVLDCTSEMCHTLFWSVLVNPNYPGYSDSLRQPVYSAKWKSSLFYSTLQQSILRLKSQNVRVLFQMRDSVDVNLLKQMSFNIIARSLWGYPDGKGVCCNTINNQIHRSLFKPHLDVCTVVSTWMHHRLNVILASIVPKFSFQQLCHLCNLMF